MTSNNKRSFFSLDPSITCTGFAWGYFTPGNARSLVVMSIGHFRPSRAKCPEMVDRVNFITDHLAEAVYQAAAWSYENGFGQKVIGAIEVPSGRVNRARHGGGGSGLSVYGFAAGACYNFLRYNPNVGTIHAVKEGWTGSQPKSKRKSVAMKSHPEYDPEKDKGGDVADAICLAAMLVLNEQMWKGIDLEEHRILPHNTPIEAKQQEEKDKP